MNLFSNMFWQWITHFFRIKHRKQQLFKGNQDYTDSDFTPSLPNIDNVMDYVFQLHSIDHQIAKNDRSDENGLTQNRQATITLPDASDAQAIVCNSTIPWF